MRWTLCMLVASFLIASRGCAAEEQIQQQFQREIFECVFEPNSMNCANNRMAREIDRIEMQISGKASKVPMSKVIEESASLLVDGMQAIFGTEDDESRGQDEDQDDSNIEEARKKKFGKKKKKHLQKLLVVAMLLKSKLSLLLQLFSAHFQIKFFVIAILSLLINAGRFWLDLKKSHRPAKVIYYEHAQHQHHYDHDDDHGIWGRSSDEVPQELAYSAYVPEH